MGYDYIIIPKLIMYSITAPVKENIILVSSDYYQVSRMRTAILGQFLRRKHCIECVEKRTL